MQKKCYFSLVPVLGLAFFLVFAQSNQISATRVLSIPASAFIPSTDICDYTNWGNYIRSNLCVFYAPVYLDQGMVVTKVTLYFSDSSSAAADYADLSLNRSGNAGDEQTMAWVISEDTGINSNFDDVIEQATIDNTEYSYWLKLILNSDHPKVYRVTVEYGFPYAISLPLILTGP